MHKAFYHITNCNMTCYSVNNNVTLFDISRTSHGMKQVILCSDYWLLSSYIFVLRSDHAKILSNFVIARPRSVNPGSLKICWVSLCSTQTANCCRFLLPPVEDPVACAGLRLLAYCRQVIFLCALCASAVNNILLLFSRLHACALDIYLRKES